MSDFDAFTALSFDCYGTLIDWETGIANALAPWAADHGLSARRDELTATLASFESGVQTEFPTALYPEVLAITLDRIAAHYGVVATPAEREAFGASVGRWPAFADSAESLARLKKRYKLIILSNVDRASFARSNERLGVEFDLIITAQDVGAYKPSEKSFPALLEGIGTVGVAKSELLHVAQSLFHDHEPAQRAGLPSVWIDRRHDAGGFGATPPPAAGAIITDWTFRSMKEFADAALS